MSVLLSYREVKSNPTVIATQKVSVEVEVKVGIKKPVDYEKCLWRKAEVLYVSGVKYLLNDLLDGTSRALTDEEYVTVERIILNEAYELHKKLVKSAYSMLLGGKWDCPESIRRRSRGFIRDNVIKEAQKHGISYNDLLRALTAYACSYPDRNFNIDIKSPLVITDLVEYRVREFGIPKRYVDHYAKPWRC